MAPLTNQQRSARSKKGWETRRKEGWKAVKGNTPATQKRRKIEGAAVVAAAHPRSRAAFNQYHNQHVWTRQNGEQINMRGFSDKNVKEISPSMSKLDATLRDDVNLKTTLKKGPSPTLAGHIVAGQHVSSKEHTHRFLRAAGMPSEMVDSQAKYMQIRQHQKSGRGTTFIHLRAFRKKAINPGGIVVHELGHAADDAQGVASLGIAGRDRIPHTKKSVPIDKQFKGRPISKVIHDLLPGDMQGEFRNAMGIGKAYGDTNALEYTTESIRHATGVPISRSPDSLFYHTNDPSPETKSFLHHNFIKSAPGKEVEANIVRKAGIHNHAGKFALAGIATVAGAEAYATYHDARKGTK